METILVMTDEQRIKLITVTYKKVIMFLSESANSVRDTLDLGADEKECIANTLEEIKQVVEMNQPFNLNREQEDFIIKSVEPSGLFNWNTPNLDITSSLGIAANLASGKYNKDENNKS